MLFEGLNILISTFYVCADGFQGLSNAFHYPIQLFTFFCFFEITVLANFKMLTETLLLCDWSMFSSADLSLAAGKMQKIIHLVTQSL